MNIHVLGAHAREMASTRCASILVDGVLALDAGALSSTLGLFEQRRLEAVLLTHVHYDHIRDIPLLAINMYRERSVLQVYATEEVCQAIETHLLNGLLFPPFGAPAMDRPAVAYNYVHPHADMAIGRYTVLPIPVKHAGTSVGYLIGDDAGHSLFYTGDTGSFPGNGWNGAFPDLIIAEVTFPNRLQELATAYRHLTPRMLQDGLDELRWHRRYSPTVVAVHMDPSLEREIRRELDAASACSGVRITPAYEGMEITLGAGRCVAISSEMR